MTLAEILSRFKNVKKTASGWMANCPCHDDRNASLSISEGKNGIVLLYCHAGCQTESIVSAIGLSLGDLFQEKKTPPLKVYTGTTRKETEYKYFDESGKYIYSSVRIDVPGQQKKFVIRRGSQNGFGETTPILYNAHKIGRAIADNKIICVVEGEKQCDNLEKIGFVATTNPLGAGKWKDSYSDILTFAAVAVFPDNDTPGENHAELILKSIKNNVRQVKLVRLPDLPPKGDVSDWIAAGGTAEQLQKIIDDTPIYIYKEEKKEFEKGFYYEKDRKEYIRRNARTWISLTEGQFKKDLVKFGYNEKKNKGERLSEVDLMLIELRENKDIDYFGSLAGYDKGYYEIGNKRLLITEGPNIIPAVKGSYDTLLKVLTGLFVGGDGDAKQLDYFLGWIKIAYESLVNKTYRPGHILVLAGERDCGKSFLQKIITEILGGRSARPYKYMTGQTDFNGELFAAEHLVIEDEVSHTDIRSRREFGNQIKQFTTNEEVRCHAKFKEALTLSPFWRISISLNDELENLTILPPLDDSILDKMIILRAYKSEMPMPTAANEDRIRFWDKIKSELPAFVDFLKTAKIPDDMKDNRFGLKYYHNPYLVEELSIISPENRLLNLIDMSIFSSENFVFSNEWKGTAQELETKLRETDSIKRETDKLLTHGTTCGTYLGRLAKKHPNRISFTRTSTQRIWTMKGPDK